MSKSYFYLVLVIIFSTVLQGCNTAPSRPITTVSSDSRHINITKEGSLQVTHQLNCISIDQVRTDYTPADLYPAVRDCIIKGQYKNAAEVFAVAGAYGYYDTFRVTDSTAHQAKAALILKNITPLSIKYPDIMKRFSNEFNNIKGNAEFCKKLIGLGKPTYQPVYMAAHGIEAFRKDYRSLIVSNFDSEAAWTKTLESPQCQ